jgi:hypothetical protein
VTLGTSLLLHGEREVITEHSDSTFSTLRLVAHGAVSELGCGSYSYGVDAARSTAAYWLGSRCDNLDQHRGTLDVADTATGRIRWHLTTGRNLGSVEPVAIVGGRVIAESDRRTSSSVVSIGADGSVRTVPGLRYAFGFDPVHEWVIGIAPSGRHVMLDPLTGEVKWSTPEQGWILNSVSPDGRYVLGIITRATTRYALLDATDGHLVARISPAGPADFDSVANEMRATAWDHDALLSDVVMGNQNALLRSDASGKTTVATEPVTYRYPRQADVPPPPSYYGLAAP